MTRWQRLEGYLVQHQKAGTDFSVYEYAEDEDLKPSDGSRDIQAYLERQRKCDPRTPPQKRTAFILRRVPGTRAKRSRWAVGMRTSDARAIGRTTSSDLRVRLLRAYQPDLQRLAELNPRALPFVEAALEATLDPAMRLMELALQGMSPDGGGPTSSVPR